jgi:D-glycero-alpha-D-manno-heptose-7-phosphate kinase
MEANWEAQKLLAPASSNEKLDAMFHFARENGAMGGKLCGAGGGGAFIFYCEEPNELQKKLKQEFIGCFEITFDFELNNIKNLNNI